MLKKNDYSLPGAILIVLSQLFSSYQSSEKLSQEIVKFREDFQQSIVERDTLFARKAEIEKISQKIDGMNDRISKLSTQIKSMSNDYSFNQDKTIVGCTFPKKIRGM